MWIMNLVWPLTALFGSVMWLAAYLAWGRTRVSGAMGPQPKFVTVAKGTSHCGAGCALGDLTAEWIAFAFPAFAVWFGWHTLIEDKSLAVWIPDFILALSFGIAFQYFSIKPMRHLTVQQAWLLPSKRILRRSVPGR